ncbi:uncharacterized protein CELE_M162.7 [Caenorhabditis elegans]|uniref:Domain of unknown function WSN domain-containing protein n=1 Tax=Caenorhabditis elegans TaxID=6239 RepID=H2L2I7_CAEEL|nr:protein of unknown function WSN domain-containing protein [Caenorhabditis elegans]CCE72323.3 Domain of unknown function WSN domain-containing protein [Caenorhabditis elegans]|eukprot:NP_507838.3 Uncharacterized protein CELE_M162.7 [Caenorhabditis elegans]
MRFLSAFVLALQIKYLTAGNYTFEPDVLLSKPAPFFSFKYIDRISTINNIAKGINLQTDLMNGKIPIDKVIGELLDVKSSNIINFGSGKIIELTDQLKDISMESSKELIGLGSDAFKYDTFIHNLTSVRDSFKFPGKDEYYAEVESVMKFNMSKLEDVMNEFQGIHLDLTQISKLNPQELTYETRTAFIDFCKRVEGNSKTSLLNLLKDVDKMSEPLEQLQKLPSVFEPFKEVSKFMRLRKTLPHQYSEDDQFLMNKNLKQVMNMAKGLKSSREDIQRLQTLRSNTKELEMVDLRNLGDPWLGKIFKVKRASLDNLASSFKPLPLSLEILNNFNKELTVVAGSSQIYDGFEQLNALLSSVPVDIEHVTGLMNKFHKCNRLPIDETFESKVNEYLTIVSEVQKLFGRLRYRLFVRSYKQLQKKIAIAIPNIVKLDQHLTKLRDDGTLKEIGKLVSYHYNYLHQRHPFDKYSKLFQKLIDGRKEFTDKVDNELSVIKCFQQLEQDSEDLQKVIQVIQKMRNLDNASVENIKGIPSVVSELLQNISKVKEVSDKMKENSNNKTLVMNALAFKESASIKSIISSVQNVYGLLDLEAPINQLKNVNSIVLEEIDKAQDPAKLQSQWGDHKADMASLQATMTSAKAFVAELEGRRAKTLLEYADPLKNLSKIPDVKMNASEKSKVIEEFIKQNSDSDLIAAKETLDKIATMDLQFSSVQYPEASFKTLQDVLLTFWSQTAV